jgi:hypothetical protein
MTRGSEPIRSDRVEQLGAREENDAGASQREDDPRRARIDFEIMAPAFDSAERQRVDH